MVFYGWNKKSAECGEEGRFCKKCSAETGQQIRHLHYTLHIYFIFTHVFRSRYQFTCMNCGTEEELACSPELGLKYGAPEISVFRRYSLVGALLVFAVGVSINRGVFNHKTGAGQNVLVEKAESPRGVDQNSAAVESVVQAPAPESGSSAISEGVSEADWDVLRQKLAILYQGSEDRDRLVSNHLEEYKKAILPVPASYRPETVKRINESLDEAIESRRKPEKTANQMF